jgi:hypothetical protein
MISFPIIILKIIYSVFIYQLHQFSFPWSGLQQKGFTVPFKDSYTSEFIKFNFINEKPPVYQVVLGWHASLIPKKSTSTVNIKSFLTHWM